MFRRISHVEDDVLCTKKKVSVKEKQWDAESPGSVSTPVNASCPNIIFSPFYNCTAGCKHLQGGQFMPFVFFEFF